MTDRLIDILIDEAHEKARGMDDYALHRALVFAGYRAGLEEVAKEAAALKKISYLGRTGDDDCDDLLRWLNAKLKEQP